MRVVLPFKLEGQTLVKQRGFPKSIADGSKDSVVIKVDGIPNGCVAVGYFKLSWENNTTYDLTFTGDELIVDEYIITLPAHATNKYIDYKFSVSVAIWEGDVERLTTNPVEVVVQKSNYTDETTNTPEIPQSQYDEILSATAEARSVASQALHLANGLDGTVDELLEARGDHELRLDELEKLETYENEDYAFSVADSEGRVAFAVQNDGKVIADSIKPVDVKLDQVSTNAIANNVVYEAIEQLRQDAVNVDAELSEQSENPVQNKAITAELHALDDRVYELEQDPLDASNTNQYAFCITDESGNVALAVDNDGKVAYVGQNAKPTKQNGNYDAEINMFICYGQSWACGYDASAITTTPRYDNLMLDTGIMNNPLSDLTAVATSFLPAVERTGKSSASGQTVGETPVTAQMHTVKQLMESEDGLTVSDLSYQLLGTAPGVGSATLARLEKGTDYYTRLINQVQQAHNIAAAMGKRLVVQAFSWVQGSLGRTGDYAEALEQLRADIDADVKAITGQTQTVKCITWQSFIYNTSLRAKQVYNQYVGAAENYPHIICAGATYHLDNVRAANLHFTAESQDWLGAYFGVAYKRTVIDGEGFEPVKPTKASKSGKILYVKFNVPQRPLVFDTERLTEETNKGFKLYDTDGAEKTITEVAIISPDTVKIVCADNVASTDRLTYGDITTDTWQWVSDNHGNLRDSQGKHIQYVSGAGNALPLHNWCVLFDKTIAELEE